MNHKTLRQCIDPEVTLVWQEMQDLCDEYSTLGAEYDQLRTENEKLHSDLFALRVEVERLRDFMNWSSARDVLQWEIGWKQRGR